MTFVTWSKTFKEKSPNMEDSRYGYTGNALGVGPEYSPPSQQQPYQAGSLPQSIRKESASFEHSEPLPAGNMSRWPLDAPAGGNVAPGGGRRPPGGESFVELTVTLQRHNSGFGFRIVGGTEEGSQVRKFSLFWPFSASLDLFKRLKHASAYSFGYLFRGLVDFVASFPQVSFSSI